MKGLCTALVIGLFFTTQLPITAYATHIATTTDGVDVTLTVTEAVVPTPTPPPPTGGGGPPGTPATIEILNVETTVGTSTATVSWETNKPAFSTFAWGATTEYELGTTQEVTDAIEHGAFLDSLFPATKYFFRITADDRTTGVQAYVGTFTTLPLPDLLPPANITNFVATPGETYIDLTWNNPPDPDFTEVRIVRSETFYPEHPFDGVVIYEGPGEFVRDRDVEPGVTYYYAAFARDQVNYSEGSITQGRLLVVGVPLPILPPFEEFPPAPEIPPELEELSLLDFDFIQDGKKIPHTGLIVPVDGGKNLTISTDYKNLPEVLKTIAFTLVDPEDRNKTFSFLLKVTPEKDTFRTTIAPLSRGGTYEMFINILDHKNQGLRKLEGELLTTAVIKAPSERVIENMYALLNCLILLILLIVALLLFLFSRSVQKGPSVAKTAAIVVLFPALLYLAFWRDAWIETESCAILFIAILFLVGYGLYRVIKKLFTRNKTYSTDSTPTEEEKNR